MEINSWERDGLKKTFPLLPAVLYTAWWCGGANVFGSNQSVHSRPDQTCSTRRWIINMMSSRKMAYCLPVLMKNAARNAVLMNLLAVWWQILCAAQQHDVGVLAHRDNEMAAAACI